MNTEQQSTIKQALDALGDLAGRVEEWADETCLACNSEKEDGTEAKKEAYGTCHNEECDLFKAHKLMEEAAKALAEASEAFGNVLACIRPDDPTQPDGERTHRIEGFTDVFDEFFPQETEGEDERAKPAKVVE